MAAIRAAVGEETELRIDFNQGYDFDTAAEMLRRLPEFGITEAETVTVEGRMERFVGYVNCWVILRPSMTLDI